jgi:NADPH2:quinone reductase
MKQAKNNTMKAVAIDRFGGPETLTMRTLPVPEVGPDEVLVRLNSADVAVWDPIEREGGFNKLLGIEPRFPHVLGTDGAGTVAGVGANVSRFKKGDQVYAVALMNPKGGFYAEYAAVQADNVAHVPARLTTEQAGVMACDALTGLRGLDDILGLKPGEALMIFGAGGGIGHLAVQLAKRMGVRVLAVASGDDGVALAQRLGADVVVNGRKDDAAAAVRAFAPAGLDAALMTAGGEAADRALVAMREGGRVAYPHGVNPEPRVRPGVRLSSYDVVIERAAIEKLNRLIEAGPFEVHVARVFRLDQAAEAHRALNEHFLGKLALQLV